MTRTCGECPWWRLVEASHGVRYGTCPISDGRYETPAGRYVCFARRAFEVLRDELRRLRAERCAMQDLRKEPIP